MAMAMEENSPRAMAPPGGVGGVEISPRVFDAADWFRSKGGEDVVHNIAEMLEAGQSNVSWCEKLDNGTGVYKILDVKKVAISLIHYFASAPAGAGFELERLINSLVLTVPDSESEQDTGIRSPQFKTPPSKSPAHSKSPEQGDEYQGWLCEWDQVLKTRKMKHQRHEGKSPTPEGLSPTDLLVAGLYKRLVACEDRKGYERGVELLGKTKLLSFPAIAALQSGSSCLHDRFKEEFPDLAELLVRQSSRYLHEFEEQAEIGQGSAGVVRLCKNRLDGHRFAVKIIDVSKREKDESREEFLDRVKFIEREAKTLADLKHDNVVRYYQSWYESLEAAPLMGLRFTENIDRLFLIQMEYCSSQLEALLDSGTHLQKLDCFVELTRGLEYVHSRNIIHRDLCPKNIFFTREGKLKIGDFGLAKHHGGGGLRSLSYTWSTETTSHTTEVGTESYAAPEVSTTSSFDTKADVYSLGVIFYDLCVGKRVDSSREAYSVFKSGQVPCSFQALFPVEAALVSRMTATNPEDRPTCGEILQILATWK